MLISLILRKNFLIFLFVFLLYLEGGACSRIPGFGGSDKRVWEWRTKP